MEAETYGPTIQTSYLPAAVAYDILRAGLDTPNLHLLRDAALVCMCYAFFARGDTGVRTETAAVRIDARGLHFAEQAKNVPRLRPYTLCLPWPLQQPHISVHQLVRRFSQAADTAWAQLGQPRPPQFFRLPSDRSALILERGVHFEILPTTIMDHAFANCIAHVGAAPGPGAAWSKKSLRSGGATCALAINVSLPRIMRWGIWKSLAAVECYLDPLAPADHAAYHFFGHLLRTSSASPI